MKILGNRLLVEPLPQITVTAGGIQVPGQWRDDQMSYRVVAVGPGRKLKSGEVVPIENIKPGDRVVAALYHDHTILSNGQRIINADQALLVIPTL